MDFPQCGLCTTISCHATTVSTHVPSSRTPTRGCLRPAAQANWGSRLLEQLPVRLDPGHCEKVSGAWRDPNGYVQRMISGVDQYREIGDQFAREHQLGDPRHRLAVTSHVEVKSALIMRERGLTNETIVINKATCDGRWSCEKMLKEFLPPGSRLVVYGPDGIGRPYYGKGDA
ncbi:DddA-like double-stranded DNA deaminase toxin [Kribbella sp. NPDC056861]|uniref:DddA-like double-stranded DNA deaminase toxin n=1 Tax=Kribbella sp. NPDC056861 TaxID=3154857 RepID=UPI00342995FA